MSDTKHRSNRILIRATRVGIVIGALSGVAVFILAFVFPVWRPIMMPPENRVDLLAYQNNAFDDNTLYVRTVSGNIYALSSSSYGKSDTEWRRVERVNQKTNSYECDFSEFPTPYPPGKIVSQLESHPCVLDSRSQVDHIILEDGSIWKWEKTTGEMDVLLAPVGVIYVGIGGVLGAIAGILTGFALIRFKKE